MPRKAREVLSGLKRKGFIEEREGHHVFLIYESRAGLRTEVRTRLSHQSGGSDINDQLLGLMARQLKLSRRELEQLIDCPLSREHYEAKLGSCET
jgi:DNA-binding FadR family transcriptional regulator